MEYNCRQQEGLLSVAKKEMEKQKTQTSIREVCLSLCEEMVGIEQELSSLIFFFFFFPLCLF